MLYNVWSNFWRQILSNTIQHDQAVQKENVWSLNSVWSLLVAKQFTFARLRKVENLWIGGVKICELSLKRSYLEQVAIFRHLPFRIDRFWKDFYDTRVYKRVIKYVKKAALS